MYLLSPNPLALFQKYEQREITSDVVGAAIATGRAALRDAHRGSRALFGSQFTGLVFAGLTPLLANVLFGWPAYLVLLGIAADNLAIWLADVVKPLLVPEAFDNQWRQQCDVSNAVAVASAVTANPREVDERGIPVYRALEPAAKPLDGYWQMGLLVGALPLSWGSLFYPSAAAENARIETFVIVAIPTIVRLVWLLVTVVRKRQSGADDILLLPQGPTQLLAFLFTALVFVLGSLLVEDDHSGLGKYDGPVFLSIYLICLAASGFWSLQRTKEAERALRRFIAMDIDALKRRVEI